eukprot:g10739.t1
MGKKREREEDITDRGGDGDIKMDQDRGAESLMFEIVASDKASSRPTGSSKRRKSSGGSAHPPLQSSNGDLDGDAAADAPAEADAAATGSAGSYHPAAIAPSSALRQCDGFDVVRKGAKGRGRQLMVLPGALGLGNGGSVGRIGSLNIATPASPVLYVEFPQGRLKCTGRTVHSKGRFLTLYGDKAAGRATRMDCRDVFDSVVFFSKACWVGRKEDNPSEEPLPLPEDLQTLQEGSEEASGESGSAKLTAADFKTHFGGGTPGSLMTRDSETKASAGSGSGGNGDGGGAAAAKGGESGGEGAEGEAQSGGASKAPARRVSSRSTKSTVTYVEDSDEEESDGGGGSSSSSEEEGDGGASGAGRELGGDNEAVASTSTSNAAGDGGDSSAGAGSGGSGVEVFSILDAPTAKRKPVTVGSGKEKSAGAAAKTRQKKQAAAKGEGRRRTLAASSSSSSSDDDDNNDDGSEDSDEASAASGEDVAAAAASSAPARRSRRSSAVSRVKYTQSSGSEEEEGEEEEGEEEEDDEFEL